MNRSDLLIFLIPFSVLLTGCLNQDVPVAYGNFEAKEWRVASSGSGEIVSLSAKEGEKLLKDQVVGQIDTTELSLQKTRIANQIAALRSSLPNVAIQVDVLKQKKKVAEEEYSRVKNLVEAGAANQKKLDQIDDEVKLTEKQITATASSLQRETAGILAQIEALRMQLDVIVHRIRQCTIVNQEEGTVQYKFADLHGFTDIGKPLYQMTDTREMTLHTWLSGEALTQVHLSDELKIGVDAPDGKLKYYTGKVTYIAEKPEFAPSQVQTKKNRSLLHYHVKLSVPNDGHLNPGTPAEIFLPAK